MMTISADIRIPKRKVDVAIETVTTHCRVGHSQIMAVYGPRAVSEVRYLAYWIAREIGGGSFTYLGRRFGRHHTCILHGWRRVEGCSELKSRALAILPAARAAAAEAAPQSVFSSTNPKGPNR